MIEIEHGGGVASTMVAGDVKGCLLFVIEASKAESVSKESDFSVLQLLLSLVKPGQKFAWPPNFQVSRQNNWIGIERLYLPRRQPQILESPAPPSQSMQSNSLSPNSLSVMSPSSTTSPSLPPLATIAASSSKNSTTPSISKS
ncbi:hypothetical protein F0562_025313 [Nyssa sinensis]|uniref:Uncharacterized protein n=1 Tax=Nyssa sinensis TaxID=561372 RepID=A0A5J5BFD1_9ASTE|nr:hypothetical protein F0562_025313 [Nyssa sinensis]